MVNAFGGKEIGRSIRGDGKIANAQIQVELQQLWLAKQARLIRQMSAPFYIYVEKCRRNEKAVETGATLEMEVGDMPYYDDRQGGVRDEWGNIWWISQRLVAEPYRFLIWKDYEMKNLPQNWWWRNCFTDLTNRENLELIIVCKAETSFCMMFKGTKSILTKLPFNSVPNLSEDFNLMDVFGEIELQRN